LIKDIDQIPYGLSSLAAISPLVPLMAQASACAYSK